MSVIKKGRVIFHCGSSKNGSSTIQNCLLHDAASLYEHGVSAMRFSSPRSDSFDHPLSLNECEFISGPIQQYDLSNETVCSFAKLYEIYKHLMELRDHQALLSLQRSIMDNVLSALAEYSIVIISAEAFETSLCLRDPFFRKMIVNLARYAAIDLVYYKPDPSRHAMSSWQQWGYIERYSLSAWLDLYNAKTSRRDFFKRRGQPYWSSLINIEEWLSYWQDINNTNLRIFEGVNDTALHFYQHFIPEFPRDTVYHLPEDYRNRGWPKNHIKMYPILFDSFCSRFENYENLKLIWASKSDEGTQDNSFYDDLRIKVEDYFRYRGDEIQRKEILVSIDALFDS